VPGGPLFKQRRNRPTDRPSDRQESNTERKSPLICLRSLKGKVFLSATGLSSLSGNLKRNPERMKMRNLTRGHRTGQQLIKGALVPSGNGRGYRSIQDEKILITCPLWNASGVLAWKDAREGGPRKEKKVGTTPYISKVRHPRSNSRRRKKEQELQGSRLSRDSDSSQRTKKRDKVTVVGEKILKFSVGGESVSRNRG